MKVLIPNATSPKNIGDLAMLQSLVELIGNQATVTLHSTEPKLYKEYFDFTISETLYSWAAFENRKFSVRILRISQLLFCYFLFKYLGKLPNISGISDILKDYLDADMLVFAGGGYLRAQKGITQTLNLLMTLFLFQFAKLFQKKKIVAPISFGPFAHKWQAIYAANVLNGFDIVAAREDVSFLLLKKYSVKNVIRSYDHALFLKTKKYRRKVPGKNLVLGFTIRKWFKPKQQLKFERNFAKSLIKFSQHRKVSIQPIVQVDAPDYGDVDHEVTKHVVQILRKKNIKVFPTKKVTSLKNGYKIYSEIDLLLGTRMHSNILACLQGTPFVAIAYEHKTKGIAYDLGLQSYCLQIEESSAQALYAMLIKAFSNIQVMREAVEEALSRIQRKEIARWKDLLRLELSAST